jgi:hypothetical protein
MAPQYKDFNKDVKDLLNKNYSKPGAWSLESKLKGGDIVVNPKADDKGVNVDFEFLCPITGCVDIKVNANGNGDIKPKFTYKKDGHKVELALKALELDVGVAELVYEGTVAGVVINNKATTTTNEFAVAYQVCTPAAIGFQLNCKKGDSMPTWAAGVQYKDGGKQVTLSTKALKSFTTGALFPATLGGYDVKFAAQVDCQKGKAAYKVGAQFDAYKGLTVKVSATPAGEVAVALIHKFATGWKVAATSELTNCCTKLGVALTLE